MISVDTQVLIWGIKKKATDNRLHMIPRAIDFIKNASEQHQLISIPALVLSEFLVRYDDAERQQVLVEMSRRFRILDFNYVASAIAAKLYSDKSTWQPIRDQTNSTKQCIKLGISILATAEAHNSSAFYVEDSPLYNSGAAMQKYLKCQVLNLPPAREKQESFFE